MFKPAQQTESYNTSIENAMRERIINQVMVSWTILCTVAFFLTQMRAIEIGWVLRDYLNFVFLSVLFVITIYRKKFPARYKAVTVIILSVATGISGISTMGMFSGGIFFLPMATVITALFYSKRTAIGFGLLATAALSIIAVAFSSGMITLPPRTVLLQSNLLHWAVYVCCFGIFLTFSCGTILSYRKVMEKIFQDENEELNDQFEETVGRANSFEVKAEIFRLEFNQVFNAIDDAVWVIGNDGRVLRINQSFLRLLNLKDKTEAVGKKCHELIKSDVCLTAECPLNHIPRENQRLELDVEMKNAAGKKAPFLLTVTPLFGIVNETIGIVEQYKDITKRKSYEEEMKTANSELRRLVTVDGLTQIANRRFFDEMLQKEWSRMYRENQPISLIISDVDFFKRYNDCYGHQEGDECLKAVAECMQNCIRRSSDLIARYGGEEFVVILPNTNSDGACIVAENMRKSVLSMQREHKRSEVSDYVTLSFGVATVVPGRGGVTHEGLIKTADDALYASKATNRNMITSKDLDEPCEKGADAQTGGSRSLSAA